LVLRGTSWKGRREDYIIKNFMLFTPYQTSLGDQINKNKMDRACGTCEGQVRCIQGFGGET